jgi:hypothetical protein
MNPETGAANPDQRFALWLLSNHQRPGFRRPESRQFIE